MIETNWFDFKDFSPVRNGLYKVLLVGDDESAVEMRNWDGQWFGLPHPFVKSWKGLSKDHGCEN